MIFAKISAVATLFMILKKRATGSVWIGQLSFCFILFYFSKVKESLLEAIMYLLSIGIFERLVDLVLFGRLPMAQPGQLGLIVGAGLFRGPGFAGKLLRKIVDQGIHAGVSEGAIGVAPLAVILVEVK